MRGSIWWDGRCGSKRISLLGQDEMRYEQGLGALPILRITNAKSICGRLGPVTCTHADVASSYWHAGVYRDADVACSCWDRSWVPLATSTKVLQVGSNRVGFALYLHPNPNLVRTWKTLDCSGLCNRCVVRKVGCLLLWLLQRSISTNLYWRSPLTWELRPDNCLVLTVQTLKTMSRAF